MDSIVGTSLGHFIFGTTNFRLSRMIYFADNAADSFTWTQSSIYCAITASSWKIGMIYPLKQTIPSEFGYFAIPLLIPATPTELSISMPHDQYSVATVNFKNSLITISKESTRPIPFSMFMFTWD